MRLHGVWVDTVVEKPMIWRCRCGAMLSTQKAMMRHVAGDTMCQHWGEGMVAYVPESFGPEAPGAGSEGSSPKQLAGLHDDELLVEKVAEAMKAAPASDDWLSEAEAAVAAVRGAGFQGGVDSLASARGFTGEDLERLVGAREGTGIYFPKDYEPDPIRNTYIDGDAKVIWLTSPAHVRGPCVLARGWQIRPKWIAVEPGALSAASSKPSGAVPLEPQEEKLEHVETALAELNGLKDADLGRYERECLEAAEGALRRALSVVPLLQDGDDDV